MFFVCLNDTPLFTVHTTGFDVVLILRVSTALTFRNFVVV
jgi:hypothetical protein